MNKVLHASEIESLHQLEGDTTIIINTNTRIHVESVSRDNQDFVNIAGAYERNGRKGYISGRLSNISAWLDF